MNQTAAYQEVMTVMKERSSSDNGGEDELFVHKAALSTGNNDDGLDGMDDFGQNPDLYPQEEPSSSLLSSTTSPPTPKPKLTGSTKTAFSLSTMNTETSSDGGETLELDDMSVGSAAAAAAVNDDQYDGGEPDDTSQQDTADEDVQSLNERTMNQKHFDVDGNRSDTSDQNTRTDDQEAEDCPRDAFQLLKTQLRSDSVSSLGDGRKDTSFASPFSRSIKMLSLDNECGFNDTKSKAPNTAKKNQCVTEPPIPKESIETPMKTPVKSGIRSRIEQLEEAFRRRNSAGTENLNGSHLQLFRRQVGETVERFEASIQQDDSKNGGRTTTSFVADAALQLGNEVKKRVQGIEESDRTSSVLRVNEERTSFESAIRPEKKDVMNATDSNGDDQNDSETDAKNIRNDIEVEDDDGPDEQVWNNKYGNDSETNAESDGDYTNDEEDDDDGADDDDNDDHDYDEEGVLNDEDSIQDGFLDNENVEGQTGFVSPSKQFQQSVDWEMSASKFAPDESFAFQEMQGVVREKDKREIYVPALLVHEDENLSVNENNTLLENDLGIGSCSIPNSTDDQDGEAERGVDKSDTFPVQIKTSLAGGSCHIPHGTNDHFVEFVVTSAEIDPESVHGGSFNGSEWTPRSLDHEQGVVEPSDEKPPQPLVEPTTQDSRSFWGKIFELKSPLKSPRREALKQRLFQSRSHEDDHDRPLLEDQVEASCAVGEIQFAGGKDLYDNVSEDFAEDVITDHSGSASTVIRGRKDDLAKLVTAFSSINAFGKCSNGVPHAWVSGSQGIGKTSLVDAFLQSVPEQTLICRGAFGQNPYASGYYSGIVDCFNGMLADLENEEDGIEWQDKVLEAIRPDVELLASLISSVSTLFDIHDENNSPSKNQLQHVDMHLFERLKCALSKIIGVVGCHRTVIFFIDDIQWAQGDSLKLLESILSTRTPNFFFVGCHSGVSFSHPLRQMKKRLSSASSVDIVLECIDTESAKAIAREHLDRIPVKSPVSVSQEFLDQCILSWFKRVDGVNPYYLCQLIFLLYEKGALHEDDGVWSLDAKVHLPKTAVGIAKEQISLLSENKNLLLGAAASLGTRHFRAQTVQVAAKVLGTNPVSFSEDEIGELLDKLEQQRLVQKLPCDKYMFANEIVSNVALAYVFPSGKIDSTVHLRLARELIKLETTFSSENPLEKESLRLAILEHYQLGSPALADESEKIMVAKMTVEVAESAMARAAFDRATEILERGLRALDKRTKWKAGYGTTLKLHLALAKCHFCVRNYDKARAVSNVIVVNARSPKDKVDASELLVRVFCSKGQYEEAKNCVLKALEDVWKETVLELDFEQKFGKVRELVRCMSDADILVLPSMTHKKTSSKMQFLLLLAEISGSCNNYKLQDLASLRMMELTIRYGSCDPGFTALIFSLVGICLGRRHLHGEAYRYGHLAEMLSGPENQNGCQAIACFQYAIRHWRVPARESQEALRDVCVSALTENYLHNLSFQVGALFSAIFVSGLSLDTGEDLFERYMEKRQWYQIQNCWYATIPHNALMKLKGNEKKYIKEQLSDTRAIQYDSFFQMMTCVFFGDIDGAHQLSTKLFIKPDGVWIPYRAWIEGLIATHQARTSNGKEKIVNIKKASRIVEILTTWVKRGMKHGAHMANILQVELKLVTEKDMTAKKASILFDAAIDTASQEGFLHHEALANERAGHYFRTLQEEKFAAIFLSQAYRLYVQWGADAKANQLKSNYEAYLTEPTKRPTNLLRRNSSGRLMFSSEDGNNLPQQQERRGVRPGQSNRGSGPESLPAGRRGSRPIPVRSNSGSAISINSAASRVSSSSSKVLVTTKETARANMPRQQNRGRLESLENPKMSSRDGDESPERPSSFFQKFKRKVRPVSPGKKRRARSKEKAKGAELTTRSGSSRSLKEMQALKDRRLKDSSDSSSSSSLSSGVEAKCIRPPKEGESLAPKRTLWRKKSSDQADRTTPSKRQWRSRSREPRPPKAVVQENSLKRANSVSGKFRSRSRSRSGTRGRERTVSGTGNPKKGKSLTRSSSHSTTSKKKREEQEDKEEEKAADTGPTSIVATRRFSGDVMTSSTDNKRFLFRRTLSWGSHGKRKKKKKDDSPNDGGAHDGYDDTNSDSNNSDEPRQRRGKKKPGKATEGSLIISEKPNVATITTTATAAKKTKKATTEAGKTGKARAKPKESVQPAPPLSPPPPVKRRSLSKGQPPPPPPPVKRRSQSKEPAPPPPLRTSNGGQKKGNNKLTVIKKKKTEPTVADNNNGVGVQKGPINEVSEQKKKKKTMTTTAKAPKVRVKKRTINLPS